jgi:hypothetical protein
MAFTDYLIAAPWWHWLFTLFILAVLSRFRLFRVKIVRNTHEHKHVHHHGKETE